MDTRWVMIVSAAPKWFNAELVRWLVPRLLRANSEKWQETTGRDPVASGIAGRALCRYHWRDAWFLIIDDMSRWRATSS